MRIGFIYYQVFRHGGVERVIANIVNKLSENHEIFIICNQPLQQNQNYYSINLDRVNVIYREIFALKGNDNFLNKSTGFFGTIIFDKESKKNIINIVNELKLDCVVGCMMEFNLLLGSVKRYLKCRVIGWEHNSYDSYFKQNVKSKLKIKLKQYITKYFLSKLDDFVVLTNNDQKLFKENLLLSSVVIENPLSFYSNKKSDICEKQILIVGRLDIGKGTDFLPDIIEGVIKHNQDWKFRVVGDGALSTKFKQDIIERNLLDNVDIIKNSSSIHEEYISSSIYICTSRFESFGLAVLEAMHCGLPIITFNTSGPSELIENKNCGFIVENNDISSFIDAINILCKDELLRKKYSKNAIKRASDFELKKICTYWECILQNKER